MPKLPDLYDSARPGPQTSGGIVGYRADFGGEEAAGRALVNVGATVNGIEERFQREQEKQAQLTAEDALNQYRAKAIDLEAGDNGYNNLRGEQAVKRPIYQEYTGKLTDAYNQIAGTLTDERAKQLFKSRADVFGLQFKEGILRHVAAQNNVYAEQTFKGALDVEQKNAAVNWDSADPKLSEGGQENNLGLSLMRTRNAVNMMAERAGWPPEYRDAVMAKSIGDVHKIVIDQALAAGQTNFATEYLKSNKEDLTDDQLKAVEAKIKPATDWTNGTTAADTAWAMIASGKPRDEVESWLTKNTKNHQEYMIAQSQITQQEQAIKRQGQEQVGGLLQQFWQNPTRATMNALLGSQAYLDMQPDERGKVSEHLHQQVTAIETHARAERSEKWQSADAYSTYIDMLEDPNFPGMSKKQIASVEMQIGPQLTNRLLAANSEMQNSAKRFQIDKDILDSALPPNLIKPGSDSERQQQKAFRGIVEANLQDWKQAHPGKTPTPEEQKGIARSALADYKVAGASWFGLADATGKVYQLKPMPDDFRVAAYAEAARLGKPKPTEEKLLQIWARQKGAR